MKGFLLIFGMLMHFPLIHVGTIRLYAARPQCEPNATYVCDYGSESDYNPTTVLWLARETDGSWISVVFRHNGSSTAVPGVVAHFTDHNSSIVVPQYYFLNNSLSKLCCSYRHNERSQFTCKQADVPTCHEPGKPLTLRLSPALGTAHRAVTWFFQNVPIATVYRPWGNVTWFCPPYMCTFNVTLNSLLIYNFSAEAGGQYTALMHSGPASLFQLFKPTTCVTKVEDPPYANDPAPPEWRPLLFAFVLCTGCAVLLTAFGPSILSGIRKLISARFWSSKPYTALQ
ncbi:284R [Bovine adenovirus 3]|uniref:284R n=1 Tax=Bovine adenovirus B serotype 3 TaxID=10510 RepID=A0A9W3IMT5_ADEB3|nr:284R [Bovine adenovirus 3]